MTLFDRLVFKTFFPVLFLALAFFVLIVQLMDLFGNLVRYLNLEVPPDAIFYVQALFFPKAITYALPVALLFATAYTLGSLYSNNELIAVFSAGVPVQRFTAPLVLVGVFASVGLFFFQEYVVIDTFRQKNELSRDLLNISRSFSNTDITVRSPGGSIIYSADYYNDSTKELSRIIIIERDDSGQFVARIDAERAHWSEQDALWILEAGARYHLTRDPLTNQDGDILSERFDQLKDETYNLQPDRFRRSGESVDELPYYEAREWVAALRDSGQPYRQDLTNYYSRFSFALTPFIVVLLSSGLGGRFKKNVLLMSLFVSLVASVVYYVTGMVAELLAGNGLIPPLAGAWTGVILFTVIGILLVRTART